MNKIIFTDEPNKELSDDKRPSKEPDHALRFHLVGAPGVGKSHLLVSYTDHNYNYYAYECVPYNIDFRKKLLRTDRFFVNTTVFDMVDKSFWKKHGALQSVDAFIVVFDLTNKESFDSAREIIANGMYSKSNMVLVGTKSDLIMQRAISTGEITDFVNNSPVEAYVETSAKTGKNVELLFETTTELVLNRLRHSDVNKSQCHISSKRACLVRDLNKYIMRIESQKDSLNNTNFYYGFWVWKKSRAINREANYHLAKKLLEMLHDSNESITSIFAKTEELRAKIIIEHNLFLRHDYKNRGIHSTELNKIINTGMSLMENEAQPLLSTIRTVA